MLNAVWQLQYNYTTSKRFIINAFNAVLVTGDSVLELTCLGKQYVLNDENVKYFQHKATLIVYP